jgi:NADH:ubiquinone oxidoreductase subunit E
MEETLEKIYQKYGKGEGNLVGILHELQEQFGYIPERALNWFSKKLDIPSSRIFGVITFYPQFNLKPKGENIITVCRGTACHINGSERLLNRLLIELGVPPSQDTTDDRKFTVEKINCIGACGMAPVVMINDEVRGKISFEMLLKDIKKLKNNE